MRKIHKLKILPEYFEAVIEERKTFEVRYNDRNFKVGDILYLQEWDGERYTGRSIQKIITYILNNNKYTKNGYIVLGMMGESKDKNAELKTKLTTTRSQLVGVLKAFELACKYIKETQKLTTACPDDFNFACVKASGGKCSWECWENFFLAKARGEK